MSAQETSGHERAPLRVGVLGAGIVGREVVRALLEPDGMTPLALTPVAFAARVKHELGQWKQIATARKIVIE